MLICFYPKSNDHVSIFFFHVDSLTNLDLSNFLGFIFHLYAQFLQFALLICQIHRLNFTNHSKHELPIWTFLDFSPKTTYFGLTKLLPIPLGRKFFTYLGFSNTDEENNENANEQIREIWSMINWSFRKALLVRMAIISLHVNVKTPFHLFSNYCRAIDQPGGGGAKEKLEGANCPPPLPWLRAWAQQRRSRGRSRARMVIHVYVFAIAFMLLSTRVKSLGIPLCH